MCTMSRIIKYGLTWCVFDFCNVFFGYVSLVYASKMYCKKRIENRSIACCCQKKRTLFLRYIHSIWSRNKELLLQLTHHTLVLRTPRRPPPSPEKLSFPGLQGIERQPQREAPIVQAGRRITYAYDYILALTMQKTLVISIQIPLIKLIPSTLYRPK